MTRWYTEHKNEHFYKEAKRLGYRARSAFKLKQIQRKFFIIRRGDTVIDLGAAPGGWSQVARELTGPLGCVISVDISPMKPLEHVQCIQGDIAEPSTIDQIKHSLGSKGADVVLSDMSPDITGTYSVDQARSIWLCERAFAVACDLLKPRGNFVCKIFEGEDMRRFIQTVKQRFSFVKMFSPEASRRSSSEVYLVAKSFNNGCHT